MRDRGMAKLFSFSCISAGTTDHPAADGQKPPKPPELADGPPPPPPPPLSEGEELESTKKRHNMIHKFMKSFSHLFSLSREDEDDEEEEREMVIGFPTDVQHVAHIGWDGFTGATTITNADAKKKSTTNNSSWAKGPELLSLDSLSLKQFQAAMVTLQAAAGDPPPLPPPSRPSPPPLHHRGFGNRGLIA